MRLYQQETDRFSPKMILLVPISIILGLLIGTAAYYVSKIFYLVIIFSFGVSFITMLIHLRLLEYLKIRHRLVSVASGIAIGSIVVVMFHYLPFAEVKRAFVADGVNNYHVNQYVAEQVFNEMLAEETGQSGLLGFLMYRANVGEQFVGTLVINYAPVHEYSFSIRSSGAWLYWFLEAVIIILPAAWVGLKVAKNPFNDRVNEWYKGLPYQIGSVIMENRDKFSNLMQDNYLFEAAELILPEDGAPHPRIEIYQNHCKDENGDILLSIKETGRNKKGKYERKMIQQWEISREEFAGLLEILKRDPSNEG